MLVLGVNCCLSPASADFMAQRWELHFHDAAAVLLRDGAVAAGIEQERLNRVKHTTAFAGEAMRACLDTAGATMADVDRIAFFFGEEYTDRELFEHYATHPALPLKWSRELIASRVREHFDLDLPDSVFEFVGHHTAHAYSAFPQSGYDDALVVVMDGAGEDNAISVYDGHDRGMELLSEHEVSRSLGMLYLAGTRLLGYGLGDEYKVMGLAPHGDPSTYRPVFGSLYELRADGDFHLDHATVAPAFAAAGFRPRRRGEAFDQRHRDFAAGLQEAVETIGWHVIGHWRRATGHRRLALAGGVAQNCTFNGRLLRSGAFDDVFVHPAAHDAGAALGAAMKVHADTSGAFPRARVRQVFWGPPLPRADELADLLGRYRRFLTVTRSDQVERDAAALVAEGKVIGWVQGRSEFGPRALGNRSILADPRPAANRDRVNRMIKQRESYRPFAPSVQAESLRDYFEFPAGAATPDFMVFTVPVRPDKRAVLGAVTHVDGSARVHAVDRRVNERYWLLLEEFERRTGVPVLLNTSFNNHAEPIVDSVEDAVQCYLTTGLDHLVVGDLVVSKLDWTDDDLCDLAPALVPSARLRTVWEPDTGPSHAIAFVHHNGGQRAIDAATHQALSQADGVRSLRRCGIAAGSAALDQIRGLWSDRYVTLRPTAP
ncbi:carbamoyltransferase family protein [Actinokineospora iranica]|uniref:Decarbamoylnovobiocin carbamoyltransferase/7-O-carbamoyltransferase n=1 Tax=Actinokineospora iranica TaxID=1271860 RepID=A0A1G6S4T5_9PSEU|nr:carbamoyltransferase C-terminal domain-containing protein [Actinokineospora iranica]SDD11157.1 decarbamoylnovobiocin carbamoyltransferase/7-O-carbamoyltransferase [Actinokineospora iranica]